jgi:hypothetical protein
MSDRATCKSRWVSLFKKALDADTWGQAIEASDFYTEYEPSRFTRKSCRYRVPQSIHSFHWHPISCSDPGWLK